MSDDEKSLKMSLEMSWRLVLARRRQILLRLGRKDSTDSADRSISKVRNWSSGAR